MADVVIPVLDEADALPIVLARMPPGYEPIIVDNGSKDGSGGIARRLGARVIVEPRRGFGSACYAGLRAATSEIVCFMDGDGTLDPDDLALVSAPVAKGKAELAIGARNAVRGAWPLHARLANRYLARVVARRASVTLHDLGPLRAARRQALLDLDLIDRRFGWPLEMVLRAADAGWRIVEVPISYAPRIGRSKVTGTVRGTARAIRDMARVLT